MDAADAERFQQVIDARIADTHARVEASGRHTDELTKARSGATEDDEHDPEGTTISQDRALEVKLREDAERSLTDLQHALTRVADGTYDICEHCGGPISLARLEVRPETRLCIDCASSRRR